MSLKIIGAIISGTVSVSGTVALGVYVQKQRKANLASAAVSESSETKDTDTNTPQLSDSDSDDSEGVSTGSTDDSQTPGETTGETTEGTSEVKAEGSSEGDSGEKAETSSPQPAASQPTVAPVVQAQDTNTATNVTPIPLPSEATNSNIIKVISICKKADGKLYQSLLEVDSSNNTVVRKKGSFTTDSTNKTWTIADSTGSEQQTPSFDIDNLFTTSNCDGLEIEADSTDSSKKYVIFSFTGFKLKSDGSATAPFNFPTTTVSDLDGKDDIKSSKFVDVSGKHEVTDGSTEQTISFRIWFPKTVSVSNCGSSVTNSGWDRCEVSESSS